jgi:anthranilate phosphoribosyltransferase
MSLDWPALLNRLVADSSLSISEATEALGEILAGDVSDTVIASFLTALTAKGESVDEMVGFVDAMMAACDAVAVPEGTIDVVGTGGDRLHSVNISTMAALTVAGCGVPVAKHGNRAASSSVGTADVLEGLGVRIDADAATVANCVREAGVGFCFAQRFHPGLRHLGPIRRELGLPTVFNLLGPLANPARVRRALVGVANDARIDDMAEVLRRRGVDHVILVHAHDGLDELSLGSDNEVVEVIGASRTRRTFDASGVFGARYPVSELVGGDLVTNVGAVRSYLNGDLGAVRDTVLANAAMALVAAGRVERFDRGVSLAITSVDEGHAATALERLVAVSNA